MYRFYLKQHIKGLVIWLLALSLLGIASIQKLVGLQVDTTASNELMEALPNVLKIAYGIGDLDITTLDGYYAVLSLYIMMAIASYAGILGSKIIYSEEDLKSSEFLFTKPITRRKILIKKVLGAFTIITVLTLISSYTNHLYILSTFDDSVTNYWQLCLSQYIVSITFLCLGSLLSCTKISSKALLITVIAIFTGFVLRMSGLIYEVNISLISPFFAFEASSIVTDSINTIYVIYYLVIGVCCLIAGNYFLNRRDINN